jgi:hypothetical protein
MMLVALQVPPFLEAGNPDSKRFCAAVAARA